MNLDAIMPLVRTEDGISALCNFLSSVLVELSEQGEWLLQYLATLEKEKQGEWGGGGGDGERTKTMHSQSSASICLP